MDEISRSAMSPEQKATATRQIIAQAIAAGGLMILGAGISTKLSRVTEPKLNQLLQEAKLGGSLEQLVKNNETAQKFFVQHGKEELNTAYNEYLLGTKTGRLKAKSFEEYLEQRVAGMTTGRRTLDSHEGVSGITQGKDVGHAILKHIGKSEKWLQTRIIVEKVKSASSFYNYEIGNRTVGKFKKQYESEINQWVKSEETIPFEATIDMKENIGLVINTNKKGMPLAAEKATKATIRLVKDNSEWGWHLFTVKLQK